MKEVAQMKKNNRAKVKVFVLMAVIAIAMMASTISCYAIGSGRG